MLLNRYCLLAIGLNLLVANSDAEPRVEPSIFTVGHAATLTVTLDSDARATQITLLPGGPYHRASLPLHPGTQGDYQLQRSANEWQLHSHHIDPIHLSPNSPKRSITVDAHRYQALGDEGIAIFSRTESTPPLAHYRTTGPALDLAVGDGLAYIASGAQGLTVLDINEPEHPLWMGSHQKLGRLVRVVAQPGRQLLALNDEGVLFRLDVSNPAEPTTLGSWRSSTAVLDIALRTDLAFVLGREQIDIIDFGSESPQISNEGLDFGQGVNFGGERRAFIDNGLAYVADWFSGIHIYDIRRPELPQLLSSFHTPGSPKGIVVRDGIAFVADDDHGLQIIDVSNPLNPKQISTLLTRGLGYTPKLAGSLLYLASHWGGFQIIDISDVTAPRLLSEFDTPGKSWSIEVREQIAYVADDDAGLLIFDVSDPTAPRQIGRFAPGGAAEEVLIRDQLAYVAFFEEGLYLLDISDPSQPREIAHLNLPGNSRGLDRVGDTLFVAGWLAGVQSIDVSDPSQPRLLTAYDTRGATWGLKVSGQHLYAMDWWGGILVLDISNPSQLRAIGGYHSRGQVNAIAIRAGQAGNPV